MSETFEKISKVLDGDEAVPRSGVEVETLAWLVDDGTRHKSAFVNDPTGWAHGYKVAELVDRSYANRLQAENAALQQRLNTADQRVDDLTTEVERQAAEFKEWQASHHANYCKAADERDALKAEVERLTKAKDAYADSARGWKQYSDTQQSELTKARELLTDLSNWLVCSAIATPEDMAQSFEPFAIEIDAYLAHQSAPAAEGEGDE